MQNFGSFSSSPWRKAAVTSAFVTLHFRRAQEERKTSTVAETETTATDSASGTTPNATTGSDAGQTTKGNFHKEKNKSGEDVYVPNHHNIKEFFETQNFRKIRKKLIFDVAKARIEELSEVIIYKNINVIIR